MPFTVNIHTENDAFEGDPSPELARILRKIADDVENYQAKGMNYALFQTILDINGNDVGRYALLDFDEAIGL